MVSMRTPNRTHHLLGVSFKFIWKVWHNILFLVLRMRWSSCKTLFHSSVSLLFPRGLNRLCESNGFSPTSSCSRSADSTHTHANTRCRHKQAPTHSNCLTTGLCGFIKRLCLPPTRGCLKSCNKYETSLTDRNIKEEVSVSHSSDRRHRNTHYKFNSIVNLFFV